MDQLKKMNKASEITDDDLKDGEERTHACLIPWDALDALSARETALTGHRVDYKQMDINNVLTLPRLLRAEEEGKHRR